MLPDFFFYQHQDSSGERLYMPARKSGGRKYSKKADWYPYFTLQQASSQS
jgi:hypothetical protein